MFSDPLCAYRRDHNYYGHHTLIYTSIALLPQTAEVLIYDAAASFSQRAFKCGIHDEEQRPRPLWWKRNVNDHGAALNTCNPAEPGGGGIREIMQKLNKECA